MGTGSASRIDDPNAAKTYRLELGYAFVRRKTEQNSSPGHSTIELHRRLISRSAIVAARPGPASSIPAFTCLRPFMRAYGRRPSGRGAKSTISCSKGLRWRSGSEGGGLEGLG